MYEYGFSAVYDKLQDIDYDSFAEYYKKVFEKFKKSPELVLDLGCGTGSITVKMSQMGYDMTGIDLSCEMLNVAREKAEKPGQDILFLNQHMTEFELYGTVDAIISSLDSVNYITEDGGVEQMLKLCNNYLNPGGLLIFDINSEYKLKNILGNNTFVYDEDGAYCVWHNFYDENERICDFELTVFEKKDGVYRRFDEYQSERAYSVSEIKSFAEKSKLEILGIYNGLSFEKPTEDAERLVFVMQKK